MEVIRTRYRARLRSPRSKYYVVEKCMVSPSDRELGGHYSPIGIVSRPEGLGRDEAYAYCARLNAEEEAKEAKESQPENR
jgi:hypothetical protein